MQQVCVVYNQEVFVESGPKQEAEGSTGAKGGLEALREVQSLAAVLSADSTLFF